MLSIWILTRHYNFSPEYIEELPPIEREIYMGFAMDEEEEMKKANNGQQQSI